MAKSGGTWTVEAVDAGSDTAWVGLIVALDTQGNPRISDYTQQQLRPHVCGEERRDVDARDRGRHRACGLLQLLALDAQDNPRISYGETPNSELKYASEERRRRGRLRPWTPPGAWASTARWRWTRRAIPASATGTASNGDLKYADSYVTLTSPVGGELWACRKPPDRALEGVGRGEHLALDGRRRQPMSSFVPRADGEAC